MLEKVKRILRAAAALLVFSILMLLAWLVSTFVVTARGSPNEIYGTIIGKWSGALCYESAHFERATKKITYSSENVIPLFNTSATYSYCAKHAASASRTKSSKSTAMLWRIIGTLGTLASPVFLFLSVTAVLIPDSKKEEGRIPGFRYDALGRKETPNWVYLLVAFLFSLVGPLIAAMA